MGSSSRCSSKNHQNRIPSQQDTRFHQKRPVHLPPEWTGKPLATLSIEATKMTTKQTTCPGTQEVRKAAASQEVWLTSSPLSWPCSSNSITFSSMSYRESSRSRRTVVVVMLFGRNVFLLFCVPKGNQEGCPKIAHLESCCHRYERKHIPLVRVIWVCFFLGEPHSSGWLPCDNRPAAKT